MLEQDAFKRALEPVPYWRTAFDALEHEGVGMHLAVFVEPYLEYILSGRKTIESRFSVRRVAPVGCVEPGDVLLLKCAAGPVVGIARISHVWTYRLGRAAWDEIVRRFGPALCFEDDAQAVETHKSCRYASLMRLANVETIPPFPVVKRDRRGWVVLRSRAEPLWLPGLRDS